MTHVEVFTCAHPNWSRMPFHQHQRFYQYPLKSPGKNTAASTNQTSKQSLSHPHLSTMKFTKSHFEKYVLCHFVSLVASSLKISGGGIPSPKTPTKKHHIGRLRKRPPGCRSTAKCLLKEAHTTRYRIDLGKSRILFVKDPSQGAIKKSPQKHRCGVLFLGGRLEMYGKGVCFFYVYCLILVLFPGTVSGALRENCEWIILYHFLFFRHQEKHSTVRP